MPARVHYFSAGRPLCMWGSPFSYNRKSRTHMVLRANLVTCKACVARLNARRKERSRTSKHNWNTREQT